ncbi:hypothetical protein AWC38_SpisGene4116 [Stylophora pistillata]|uniref:Uncharacterized protein n=1 Tax=Stylophora pistillata TaxID=50429 RepID=A0A2B4SMB6_STYPI|nr:hypothetical protein AWC38_SpisGene4116 [Stylophora pistillata]
MTPANSRGCAKVGPKPRKPLCFDSGKVQFTLFRNERSGPQFCCKLGDPGDWNSKNENSSYLNYVEDTHEKSLSFWCF